MLTMRRIAWGLLLLFVFTIPWEYALILAAPFGNIARMVGIVLLLVSVPAVLQAGRLRNLGPLQWLVLALYLWICCSYFWTIDSLATWINMRSYFQKMMVVWLVWEFVESPGDLRDLLRANLAGSWLLAALTVANVGSPEAIAAGQTRFVAEGQDPNDVAHMLVLGLPIAALLFSCESHRLGRRVAVSYLPLGVAAILLTGSRGGFLAAIVALAGCAILLFRSHHRGVIAATLALPAIAAALWYSALHETAVRLGTIPEQLWSGDLNRRWNIWSAGWDAFVRAPVFGYGAGTFALAAAVNSLDTAHNTALSLLVSGGLTTFFLAVTIVALTFRSVFQTRGSLRFAMLTAMLAWGVTALVSTVEESRATWVLLALVALAGRLAREDPKSIAACFTERPVRIQGCADGGEALSEAASRSGVRAPRLAV